MVRKLGHKREMSAHGLDIASQGENQEVAALFKLGNAFLYLSQKIGQAQDVEHRQALLAAVQHGSVVSWHHVNLHGEYDFSDEKMQDSVGLHMPPELVVSLS